MRKCHMALVLHVQDLHPRCCPGQNPLGDLRCNSKSNIQREGNCIPQKYMRTKLTQLSKPPGRSAETQIERIRGAQESMPSKWVKVGAR